ncbi:hypothetical protein DFP72DRAFT_1010282 [Ephemerocybe angulata]|uniref:Uncharacterized protein n=1 Tax=Ephemerocybe angulata TaxID=980116 RepID=A0A8H6HXV6_9AGAR|nr:hypothetical protein DFP72DRAFT_1010282 [Tulosesus angulatus]
MPASSVEKAFDPNAGVVGPAIKISWTGSPGGKSGAASINTDTEFANNIKALLMKKTKPAEVCIELSAVDLEPFRIQDAAAQAFANAGVRDGDDQELTHGTHIPSVNGYSDNEQRSGEFIQKVKLQWKCEQHHSESGGPGYCYVTSTGSHVRLNNNRLKAWAAAWHAGAAHVNEPPNIDAFDGHLNGLPSAKIRGTSGPRQAAASNLTVNQGTQQDISAMMMALMVPALTSLINDRKRPRSLTASPVKPRTREFHTPSGDSMSASTAGFVSPPMWSLPTEDVRPDDVVACLAALAREGTDFTEFASNLAFLDLTPQVIPDADNEVLEGLLGGPEVATYGRILTLKQFCRRWDVRLGKQRAHDVFRNV